MRILDLKLENTKSYVSSHIHFTEGTNAIVGQNGAGKSTILEAIGFALFDAIGYRQSDFVREGQKSASITVTFLSSLDERQYQVVRRCGSSSLYYVYDPALGTRLCEGKADVQAFLKEHMGVESTADLSTLFSDAVGVPQGTLTTAFLQSPAVRKTVFDTLLQVNEYKEAAERLLDPSRTLQKGQQKLDLDIKERQTRLERLPELEETLVQRAQQIQNAQKEQAQAQQHLQEIQTERAALDAVQKQLTTLENSQQQNQQRLHTLSAQLETAQQSLAAAQEAREVVQAHEDGYTHYLATQKQQASVREQERQRQRVQAEYNAIDKSLSNQQAEVTRYKQVLAEIAEAEQTVQRLQADVVQQTQLDEELALIQQQILRREQAQRSLAEQTTQVQRLEKQLAQLEKEHARAEALHQQRSQTDGRLRTVREEISTQQQALAGQKTTADALKKQISALHSVETATCPVCEQPLTAAHRTEMIERNEQQLNQLRGEYRQINAAIKEHQQREQATLTELETIDKEIRRLPRAEELENARADLARQTASMAELQAQVEEGQDTEARRAQIEKALSDLNNPRQRSAIAADTARRRPQVEQKIAELENECAAQEQTLATLQTQREEFGDLDATLSQLERTLEEHEPAYQAVLTHRKLAESIPQHTATVESLSEQRTQATQEMERLAKEISTVESQFNAARYHQVVEEEQQLRTAAGRLEAQLTLLCADQERDQQTVEQLRTQQQALEGLQAERETLQQQSTVLETLRSLLRQAGPYITRALIRQVSSGAAQIFSELLQDYSRHLTWTEDYGITLTIDGRERQFVQLSGGEQMSAALAVRLALLREMSSINVAFFDEPTTNLDETRRESLARQILDVKGFEQMFVISHDDTFEQATQNVIRVQKVNGISQAQSAQ